MMKKILVTGATGFIGRKLIPKLAKKNKVACFVRKTSKIGDLKARNVFFKYGDMLEKNSIFSAIKNMDVVIHLATSHLNSNGKKNIIGSNNIIQACKKNKTKRIIFISSMAVKRKNLDDYGKAKLQIERMIVNSQLNYIILRPSIIYSENNLALIEKSLKSIPFIIPVIGNGKYKLNPVYIDDVIKAICAAVNCRITNKTYDVAGAKKISFNEIIDISKKYFSIKKIKIHMPVSLCAIVFKFFPIISVEAVKGIGEDTNADINGLERDLKVHPVDFIEGIKNVTL